MTSGDLVLRGTTESAALILVITIDLFSSKFPVLLQGETSVGKTSLIKYLAGLTGNTCVRINNHEHTDLQEYLGSYSVAKDGKLKFSDG